MKRSEVTHLVHQIPGRMRFKCALLSNPMLDYAWLQNWLEAISGVSSVRINRPARSLIIHCDSSQEAYTRIIDAVQGLHEQRIPLGEHDVRRVAEIAPMVSTLGVLTALPFLPPPAKALVTFLNISRVLFTGVETLVTRGVKVEVLDAVAMGISALRGEYFTTNITQFLMELGTYLELSTARQSDTMLRKLLRPVPTLAWVERDGQLLHLPDNEIVTGETVQVGVGEKVPVDGIVLGGSALVDQCSVTGESVPERKEVMDRVIAGSVVEEGRLRIEARHVGEDTTTARISRFIEGSIDNVAQSQRVAEQLADKRVYLTLGTGAAVYLLTGDQRRLESIFLVDYSCALKLGTPLAFKSGMYNAANSGVLVKSSEALEKLAGVDTVVFDKTGTLTESKLQVTDVVVLEEHWTKERLLAVTASIEEHASHPVAEAIVRKAKEEKLNHIDHGEVDYLVAHGMTCKVNGDVLKIGSRHFIEDHEHISFHLHQPDIDRFAKEGKTLLYVATSREAVGLIVLQDKIRAEARQVVELLRELGVQHTVLLTGDRQSRADALAQQVGVDEVFAEQVPESKAQVLEQLHAEGRRIVYVGDGVNDGPALVAADVGIAMSHGAELARATADMVLLEDRLESLVHAIAVSQQTMKLVRANYNAAIGVNTGLMVGAALGWLSPITTAVVHNGTTVLLLLKALRGAGQNQDRANATLK